MKVQHPAFPNDIREVRNADGWLAAGWLPVKPPTEAPEPDVDETPVEDDE